MTDTVAVRAAVPRVVSLQRVRKSVRGSCLKNRGPATRRYIAPTCHALARLTATEKLASARCGRSTDSDRTGGNRGRSAVSHACLAGQSADSHRAVLGWDFGAACWDTQLILKLTQDHLENL